MIDDRRLGWGLAALGMLLVSTDSLWVRLAEADAWDVAFLVGACSLPVQVLLSHRFDDAGPVRTFRSWSRPLLLVAALAATSQIAFITALTRTRISNAVVIVAAAPLLAAVIGRLVFGERTSPRVWAAIVITISGIVIVVGGSLGEPTLDGDLLALLAVAAFAANINIWRRYPDMSRFAGLAISAAMVVAVTSLFASPFSLEARTYLAAAAMGLVFNPLGRIAHSSAPRFAPAAEVALFTPVETVAATMWAWIAFSESPEVATYVGATVVIGGVLFGTLGQARPARVVPRP